MGKQSEVKTKRGRPPLDQRVKEIIFLAATRDREADRKDVAAEIGRSLQERELKQPAFSTLMSEISEARRTPKSPLEEPWCVGSMATYPIQTAALPALLEVWKVSIAKQEPLTIREAGWVCRLHSVVKKPYPLREWAKCYATHELAAEATKSLLDTSAIDTALAMNLWEAATAFVTGIAALPGIREYWIPGPVECSSEDAEVSFENALNVLGTETCTWVVRAVDPDARQSGLTGAQEEAFDKMMRRHRKGVDGSVQAAWVLFYWLVYLRRGPKWGSLRAQRVKQIMEQLCAWASNIVKRGWEDTGQFVLGNVSSFDLLDLVEDPVLIPMGLLKAVGYETDRKTWLRRVWPVEGKGEMVVSDEEAAALSRKYKWLDHEHEEEAA